MSNAKSYVPVGGKIARTISHFARMMITLDAGLATIAGALMQGAAMAYREVSRVEIAEVVRRWQSVESQRQIATGTGLSWATVRRYIKAGVG